MSDDTSSHVWVSHLYDELLSKLLECLLEKYIRSYDTLDDRQFGFKSGLSTSTCTNVLKQTVDYFTDRGSHVFACFVNFSKAFDRVNYWTLFNKLLDDNVNCKIVRFLAAWYSTQTCSVKWGGATSLRFRIGNETRQGVLYRPCLHATYVSYLALSEIQALGVLLVMYI